jgi:hypothetical protein
VVRVNDNMSLLELSNQVRDLQEARHEDSVSLLTNLREAVSDTENGIAQQRCPHQQAIAVGNLLVSTLELMSLLKLDPIGCCALAGADNERGPLLSV